MRPEVERIIRVDHAGEYGAINIYKAQLLIARFAYKNISSELENMLSHEKQHFKIFNDLLITRSIRHCYALSLWAMGGFLLGLFTALLGRNAIWTCTSIIESTVLHHLEWQLEYLHKQDNEVYTAVLSIKSDEERHQALGQINSKPSFIDLPLRYIIKSVTTFAIWLSMKM